MGGLKLPAFLDPEHTFNKPAPPVLGSGVEPYRPPRVPEFGEEYEQRWQRFWQTLRRDIQETREGASFGEQAAGAVSESLGAKWRALNDRHSFIDVDPKRMLSGK